MSFCSFALITAAFSGAAVRSEELDYKTVEIHFYLDVTRSEVIKLASSSNTLQ